LKAPAEDLHLTKVSRRPFHLYERLTDERLDQLGQAYEYRRLATAYVQQHCPWYEDPDPVGSFEAFLDEMLDWIPCERTLLTPGGKVL
jgi:hypothetical protein